MPMPASGCIALRNCITGINCSSISCAVTGTVGPVEGSSLSDMFTCAGFGKGTPSMSCFYGYDGAKPVNFTLITACDGSPTLCYRTDCINPGIMNSGDCFCINLPYTLTTDNGKTTSCLIITCNSSIIFSCSVSAGNSTFGNYSYTHRASDTVCTYLYVRDLSLTCAVATSSIGTITNIVGSYCIGTTCCCLYICVGNLPT